MNIVIHTSMEWRGAILTSMSTNMLTFILMRNPVVMSMDTRATMGPMSINIRGKRVSLRMAVRAVYLRDLNPPMIELPDLILKVMAAYGNGYEQPGDSKSVQRVSGALVQSHDSGTLHR